MSVIYVTSANKGIHSCGSLAGSEYSLQEKLEVDALFYTKEDTSMDRWLPIQVLVSEVALASTL